MRSPRNRDLEQQGPGPTALRPGLGRGPAMWVSTRGPVQQQGPQGPRPALRQQRQGLGPGVQQQGPPRGLGAWASWRMS